MVVASVLGPDRDCLCPRQKLFISRTENVYVRDRECICPRQRMSMSETENVSETHTECFRVINWPPSRLRTCFRHQSESKWCEKFAGNVRNVRNTLRIMKIRLHFFSRFFFQNFGKKYVDVELKIKLFCGFRPYEFENRAGGVREGPGGIWGTNNNPNWCRAGLIFWISN